MTTRSAVRVLPAVAVAIAMSAWIADSRASVSSGSVTVTARAGRPYLGGRPRPCRFIASW